MDAVEARRSSNASSSPEFKFWPLHPNLAVLDRRRRVEALDQHLLQEAGACSRREGPGTRRRRSTRMAPAAAGNRAAGISGGSAGLELNINIWPFSWSRSAGGGSGSSKLRPPARIVSSAPCSRSNSRGEAGSAPPLRRWAASPGRSNGSVPLGRSCRSGDRGPSLRPLLSPSLSRQLQPQKVSFSVGYRHQVSCRRADVGATRGPSSGGGGLFGIKGLFSKKVD